MIRNHVAILRRSARLTPLHFRVGGLRGEIVLEFTAEIVAALPRFRGGARTRDQKVKNTELRKDGGENRETGVALTVRVNRRREQSGT